MASYFACKQTGITLVASLSILLSGCGGPLKKTEPTLEAMSVTWGTNLLFEQQFWKSFGSRNAIKTQYVPNVRLDAYRQLLGAHSKAPDLLELDVVWASILADDLLDLRPYVKDQAAFVPQLLANYTVNGRLVALPVYVDLGVLFYRPDLLEKYGFSQPPQTWDQLTQMAKRIQDGERRAGNKDFWGYVWQGSASEGGTCNALEWQSSAGAGNFLEPPGQVNVRSPLFAGALERARDWIGTISPPAEYVYHEDDSVNLWDAGQTAFMRNWASGYNQLVARPGHDRRHFAVAPLPAGPGGHKGTLGGLGIAVSKYAANQDMAIKGLLELTSEQNDLARLLMTEGIPSRIAVMQRPEVKAKSLLLAVSTDLMETLVARPSLISGEKYDAVSLAYATAVSSVLRRAATPDAAMAGLEKSLMRITGFPATIDKDAPQRQALLHGSARRSAH
jgi:trehalose/maltose transport system substrate-binding protein